MTHNHDNVIDLSTAVQITAPPVRKVAVPEVRYTIGVAQVLDPTSTIEDIEAFVAQVRRTYGDEATPNVGVIGDERGVRLFAEVSE